jgi:hypothetical protein
MSTAALLYPAPDPRGPMRKIVAIKESSGPTLITKDCGHTSEYANHFTYKVGASLHCYACGQQSKSTGASES